MHEKRESIVPSFHGDDASQALARQVQLGRGHLFRVKTQDDKVIYAVAATACQVLEELARTSFEVTRIGHRERFALLESSYGKIAGGDNLRQKTLFDENGMPNVSSQ